MSLKIFHSNNYIHTVLLDTTEECILHSWALCSLPLK